MVYEHSNIYDTFDDFSQYGGDDTKSFEGFVYGGENNNDDKIKTYMGDIYNKLSTNIYDYDKNINHNLSPVITKINDINTNFFKFFITLL